MRNQRTRKQSGSVLVEFTLSLSFLIPLFLGAWSYGYSFFQYSKLENAVRAGARYASMQAYDASCATSTTSTPSDAFRTAVEKMTVYGDPAADTSTATPVVTGLATSNVQLDVTCAASAPSTMTVSIKNFNLQAYTSSLTLTNKPYAWFPYLGYFTPP